MSLLKRLMDEMPERNPLFTAMETLSDISDIIQFYKEYVDYLKTEGNTLEVRSRPVSIANKNIGYLLGYYDNEIRQRWKEALPYITHPVYGEDIFSDSLNDAYESGRSAAEGRDSLPKGGFSPN